MQQKISAKRSSQLPVVPLMAKNSSIMDVSMDKSEDKSIARQTSLGKSSSIMGGAA